jgi:tetratricopeptide (TPR) repeat protein
MVKKINKKPVTTGSSKKRILLFKGISITLVPLLILLFFELVLRLFHYGHNLNLFVEYKSDSQYLVFNSAASKRYFTDQDFATTGNYEPFKKKKDNNTIRIFVLGESTTIGYPYFHNGSFHRWLQYRLMHNFPDKNFEVINLSLTAVNSYTVLGFAKELVNYEPDAVLIYTGHNEFYGALGAASTQNISSNRFIVNLILKLRELKITQLLTNVYNGIANFHKRDYLKNETRMQLMAADEQIPYQSDLYQKGLSQFKANMNDVFSLFNEHHIPVFVSDLVSNEKDLKPFISFEAGGLQEPAFKENYLKGVKAFNKEDYATSYSYLNLANKEYSGGANCNYDLGRVCFSMGNFKEAQKYFLRAKDLDGLRFRAPEQFNTIITQLCHQYPYVHFVDTRAGFDSFSDHGIIGNNLILDHVHPNLNGYAIMSDAFYLALKKADILPPASSGEMSFQQLSKNMPINKVDSIAGIYRILNLKKHWPYNDPHSGDSIKINSEEQSLAYDLVFNKSDWRNTMDVLYSHYINNHQFKDAAIVLESLVLENPTDADLYEKLGMLSGSLHDDVNTLYCFKRSFAIAPSFDKAKYIFVIYLKADQPVKALPYLDYAITNNTNNLNLDAVKSYTEDVIQQQKMYSEDATNINLLNRIANDYLMMNNRDAAEKYIGKALKLDNKNHDAQLLVSKINAIPGQ